MRVWDVGGPSDALVTVLDDISSSPCNDTDQKHHQMYHFQTWIQWQQTVRKQRIARPQLWAEARTRMIRAMGGRDPAAAMMDRHLCDGHNAETEIAMCPPVTWSDQSRMFAARFSFNLSLIFTVSEWKEEGLLFLSRPPPHYSRSDISRVLSKCKYGNYSRNVDSVSSLSATNTSPRCPVLLASPLSLALVWVSPSVSVALWHSPCEHLPDTHHTHSHDTQVRIIKMQ